MSEPTHNDIYNYVPSLPPAALFAALFGIVFVIHLYQLFSHRVWFFVTFNVGIGFEVFGYIFRVLSVKHSTNVPFYAIDTVLILVAPALFAASIYMVYGRLVTRANAEHLSLISAKRTTRLFVIGDVCAFLAQTAGAGLQASKTSHTVDIGIDLLIAGLSFQAVWFAFFIVVAVCFHVRLKRAGSLPPFAGPRSWLGLLYGLYAGSILIMGRCIFRIVEYAQGYDGFLLSHELYDYIFDSAFMFVVTVLFIFCYPAAALVHSSRPQQSR